MGAASPPFSSCGPFFFFFFLFALCFSIGGSGCGIDYGSSNLAQWGLTCDAPMLVLHYYYLQTSTLSSPAVEYYFNGGV